MRKFFLGMLGALMLTSVFESSASAGFLEMREVAKTWEGTPVGVDVIELKKGWDGVSHFQLSANLNFPLEEVWQAIAHPEVVFQGTGFFKSAKVIEQGKGFKTLSLEIVALGDEMELAVQYKIDEKLRIVYSDTIRSWAVRTESRYRLFPSEDGRSTIFTLVGSQADLIPLPFMWSLQQAGIKQSFVAHLDALRRHLESKAKSETQ
jgi:hypothetical protein